MPFTILGASGFSIKLDVIPAAIPVLIQGAYWTIVITFWGVGLGFIIGVIFGFGRLSKRPAIYFLSTCYVEVIRGTPILVQLLWIYFGLGMIFNIGPLAAAVASISVNSGAYISEIVRGGIQSIERGQMEAGRSLGMTHFQTMRYIIWPQAFRRIIPPLGNQFIISLKDTSLLSFIAVRELTRQGQIIIATNFRAFEIFTVVGIMYLLMTLSISFGLRRLERKLDVAG